MTVLGLDCAGKTAGVALCRDGELFYESRLCAGFTHSETLLPLCEEALRACRLSLQDISLLAVTAGPGSFTGLRIGLATVKGLAFAHGTPCAGVSTLEAMAHQLEGREEILCPVMDARRSQVYNAKFAFSDGRLTRLCEDRALSVEELLAEAKKEEKEYFFVGDGALMCYNIFSEAKVKSRLAPEPLLIQSAWGVCRAAESGAFASPDDLVPNYLRLSQAERERLEREER